MKPGSSTPAPNDVCQDSRCGRPYSEHNQGDNYKSSHSLYECPNGRSAFTPAPEVAATSDNERPTTPHQCPVCGGERFINGMTCRRCQGKGLIPAPVSVVAAPTGGSEGKHTPAPYAPTKWKTYTLYDGTLAVIEDNDTGLALIICEFPKYKASTSDYTTERLSEIKATNAELIARSPETARELAALKALLARIVDGWYKLQDLIPDDETSDVTEYMIEEGKLGGLIGEASTALGEKTATKEKN